MRVNTLLEENGKSSKSDLIHLLIFDILHHDNLDSLSVYKKVESILKPLGKPVHQSYVYQIMKKMKGNGWIDHFETNKRLANYHLTAEGTAVWHKMKVTNRDIYPKLIKKIQYFISVINNEPALPVILNKEEMKLFNRTINVKIAIHYLLMHYLCQHETISGLSFMKAMKDKHDWEFNDSYFYQVTRMMESSSSPYITGQWDNIRTRNAFMYEITAHGRSELSTEFQAFSQDLKEQLAYLTTLIKYMSI